MKESARPAVEPTPRAQARRALSLSKGALRVKGMALDLATDLADGYRKSTRTFKLQLAVVGAWFLLVLLTIALMPGAPGGRSNSLGADVQVHETLLGTQLKVENTSSRMWTDVRLTLDGGWQRQISTLREGQRIVIATSSFTRDGAAAPGDLKPRTLTIQCAQGKVIANLSGGTP
jgi:hypothetical protein